jgi:hypothetical protein
VKDLEASLLELHQIFLDMAVLVEAQGEMLDNIEQQVGILGLAHLTARCRSYKPLVSDVLGPFTGREMLGIVRLVVILCHCLVVHMLVCLH